jgi:hypothetical protein
LLSHCFNKFGSNHATEDYRKLAEKATPREVDEWVSVGQFMEERRRRWVKKTTAALVVPR